MHTKIAEGVLSDVLRSFALMTNRGDVSSRC